MATDKGKTLVVEQTGSPIRRSPDQRQTLVGNSASTRCIAAALWEDTPSVRGMIAKVQHLVRVVDEA